MPKFKLGTQIAGIAILSLLFAAVQFSYTERNPTIVFEPIQPRELNAARNDTDVAGNTPEDGEPVFVPLKSAKQIKQLIESGEVQFVDARRRGAFRKGHIPTAINIPFGEFLSGDPENFGQLLPEAPTVVYCEDGRCDTSRLVARQLVRMGFENVQVIEKGFDSWIETSETLTREADETDE